MLKFIILLYFKRAKINPKLNFKTDNCHKKPVFNVIKLTKTFE